MNAAAMLATAVLAQGAGPAPSLTGQCLWDAIPPSARDELIRAYEAGGDEAIGGATIGLADPERLQQCLGQIPDDDVINDKITAKISGLMASAPLEHVSAALLLSYGFGADALDGAWSAMSLEDRQTLHDASSAIANRKEIDGHAVSQTFIRVAKLAGYRKEDDPKNKRFWTLADYFLARAIREDWEAR